MEIHLSSGTGSGPTKLAALDAALLNAGVGNYNLVHLSSSIPPGATIVRGSSHRSEDDWGQRLYVVLAERREAEPGSEAWAGLGWVQEEDGRGLFVEHVGGSRCVVEQLIESSLSAMVKPRARPYGDVESCVAGITCESEPVCAVVVAGYQVQPWP